MLEDLRFGLKLFWKEKAFTLTALLTLALCIGANTAIFTVLKAVILEPLPFAEPDRLVTLYNIYPGVGVTDRAPMECRTIWTEKNDGCIRFGRADRNEGYDVGAEGSRCASRGQYVTPSYFQVLRVTPMLGPASLPKTDAVLGKEKFAILSYGLWKDTFAQRRELLGQRHPAERQSLTALSASCPKFRAPDRESKLWVPFAFTPQTRPPTMRATTTVGA